MEPLSPFDPPTELRALRAGLNVSQAKMADYMGVPIRTYEDLEAGRSTVRPVHLKAAYFALIQYAAENNGYADLPLELGELVRRAGR